MIDVVQCKTILAIAKQSTTALNFAPRGYHLVNALDLLLTQPYRHAKLAQIAVGAGDFDSVWIHGNLERR